MCSLLADKKAHMNALHRKQIIDTTLLKCYLQVCESIGNRELYPSEQFYFMGG